MVWKFVYNSNSKIFSIKRFDKNIFYLVGNTVFIFVTNAITDVIIRLIGIDIAPLVVLLCNYPLFWKCTLLKDISFNTKCLLVWCDQPVITYLVRAIFRINHPGDFWKLWNNPRFTRTTPKFSKMHSGNLSQIALPNMLLPVLTR